MLIAIAATGLNPRSLNIGGNIAGVTIPRAVDKLPKPIPKNSVCSSLFVVMPFI